MKKEEEWKTVFRIRYGHYEYLIMLFGLTNASTICQALINHVLREYLDICCVVYLDDILIYSISEEEHIKNIQNILRYLANFNLKLKFEKCQFHTTEVDFLGYLVSTEGIKVDPEKVKAIQE